MDTVSRVFIIIAALEWVALGIYQLNMVRKWNKKFSDLYDECSKILSDDNDV